MSLDLSGNALADILSAAGYGAPALPANPTQAQIDAHATAVADQAAVWGIVLTYLTANAVIHTTDAVTVPASGLNDSSGHPCTGTASGTGSGTGTIS